MKNKIIDLRKAPTTKLNYIGKWSLNGKSKSCWRILVDDKGNVYRQQRGKI